jgi:hypothetical protein
MQTILAILKMAGGWHPGLYLEIDNAPFMELVIEAMDESGPMGLPAISVAHCGEQNGDLMRDPEMCFELGLAGGAYLRGATREGEASKVKERFWGGTRRKFSCSLGKVCSVRNRKSRGPPRRRTTVKPRASAQLRGDRI